MAIPFLVTSGAVISVTALAASLAAEQALADRTDSETVEGSGQRLDRAITLEKQAAPPDGYFLLWMRARKAEIFGIPFYQPQPLGLGSIKIPGVTVLVATK